MIETNAKLEFENTILQVRVTRNGNNIIIRRPDGEVLQFPEGIGIDFRKKDIFDANGVVGHLDMPNFLDLPVEPVAALTSTTGGSSSSSSSGGDGTADTFTGNEEDPGAAAQAASPSAASSGDPLAGVATNGGAHGQITATLIDGGARDAIIDPTNTASSVIKPVTKPTSPTSTGGSGTGTTGSTKPAPTIPNTTMPPPKEITPTAKGGPGNLPRNQVPTEFAQPGNWVSTANSIAGPTSMGIATLQAINHWTKFSWLAKGSVGSRVVGGAGGVLGGLGVLTSIWDIRANGWSFPNSMALATSLFGEFMGVWQMTGYTATGAYIAAGVVVATVLVAWLGPNPIEQNELGVGDPGRLAIPWPTLKNMAIPIVLGSALTGIGIDLSVNAPPNHVIPLTVSEMPGVRDAMQNAIEAKYQIGDHENMLGKIFIANSGNNGITPDQLVYVDKIGDEQYRISKVSLDSQGTIAGKLPPGSERVAFFEMNSNGAIVPSAKGSAALQFQTALAQAANADNLNIEGRQGAILTNGVVGYEDKQYESPRQ